MSLVENALHRMSSPALAYLLFLLGVYGIMIELANPGPLFPGLIGAVCAALAFVSMGTLQVSWLGVGLMVAGLFFFLADTWFSGYGSLTIGGVVAFWIGSAFLFSRGGWNPSMLSRNLISAGTALTALFFLFVIRSAIRPSGKRAATVPKGN